MQVFLTRDVHGGRADFPNNVENTSYYAMLNIAELVPPPESVPIPFDSEIHGIPGISWIRNQLKLQELSRIPELRGIPGNQWDFIGTEFRESDGTDSAMFNIAE